VRVLSSGCSEERCGGLTSRWSERAPRTFGEVVRMQMAGIKRHQLRMPICNRSLPRGASSPAIRVYPT